MRDKQPPYRLLLQQPAALSGVRPPAKVSQEAERYLYEFRLRQNKRITIKINSMGKLPCPLGWDFLFPEHRCQGGTSGPGRSGSTLGTGGMISGSCLLAFVACATETFARTQVLVAGVAGISLLPTHDRAFAHNNSHCQTLWLPNQTSPDSSTPRSAATASLLSSALGACVIEAPLLRHALLRL